MTDSPFDLEDAASLIQTRESLQEQVNRLQREIDRIDRKLTTGLRLDEDPVAVPDGNGHHWLVTPAPFDQVLITSTRSLEPEHLKPEPSDLGAPGPDCPF